MLDDHAMEYKQHGWVAANELNAAGAALRDVRRIPPKRDIFSSGGVAPFPFKYLARGRTPLWVDLGC